MPIKWKKIWISDENYETVGIFDVNNDGIPDIVSGGFWYEGPDFRKKRFIATVTPDREYFEDFATIPMDVNGDGYPDIITGGWSLGTLIWRENPRGESKPWTEHVIEKIGNIEGVCAWDIDGDGQLEIVPNTPSSRDVYYYKPERGAFRKIIIHSFPEGTLQGHGIGAGDLAGAGRLDLLFKHGWLEAPANPETGEWIYHPDFQDPPWGWCGSNPMIVADINNDGRAEIISGSAHGYGLWWSERKNGKRNGEWIHHPIDPFNAQSHKLAWADIDGDGIPELITGKRHRAHCGNDAGEWDDAGIYYFKWTGEGFAKQIIDYGPLGACHGVGIDFALADLRGTGRPDLITAAKGGLFVYQNEGM